MLKTLNKYKRQNKEKFKVPRCVQDTIPIDKVYKDGIFLSASDFLKHTNLPISTTPMHLEKIKKESC